jgi:hypothetical protein
MFGFRSALTMKPNCRSAATCSPRSSKDATRAIATTRSSTLWKWRVELGVGDASVHVLERVFEFNARAISDG